MKKILKIGIVILHFGRKADTIECLQSVKKLHQTGIKLRIYLVNNDPENVISKEELIGFRNTKIISTGKNLGFGGGMNVGCRKALADKCGYILLLNNDTVVKKDFFIKLIPYFKDKTIGLISPVITYYNRPNVIWCAKGYLNRTFLYSKYPHMGKVMSHVMLDNPIEADFGAAALLVDSKVFRKIGFLDEKYFLNVEDIEFCFRAKQAGYRIVYAPYPLVLHKVSANTGIRGTNTLNQKQAFFYARNFFILLRDHRDYFNIYTALIGQTFIRLPFYTLFRSSSFFSAISYCRGYIYGMVYLLTGKLLSF